MLFAHLRWGNLLAPVTMFAFATASTVAKQNVPFPAALASYKAASAHFINSSKDASLVANAIPTLAPMLTVAPVDNGYGSDSSWIVRCASAALAEDVAFLIIM